MGLRVRTLRRTGSLFSGFHRFSGFSGSIFKFLVLEQLAGQPTRQKRPLAAVMRNIKLVPKAVSCLQTVGSTIPEPWYRVVSSMGRDTSTHLT